MPTPSKYIDPLDSAGDQGLLREALQVRAPYVIPGSENPQDFVAIDADTGAQPQVIFYGGRPFYLDALDTTTAHDGVTCLVTNDGFRYKIVSDFSVLSVLDNDLSAPPALPAIGDRYLVPAGATGLWSGESDSVAVYTARGWEFVTPVTGRILYVEDEDAFFHYSDAGNWDAGFGDTLLSASSVLPANLLGGRPFWAVESQSVDAPPGAPADGVQYIIGPVPSGAWAGNAGKLAIAKNNAWIIVTPGEGWHAYDRTLERLYYYTGTEWSTSQAGLNLIQTQVGVGVTSMDFTTGFDDTYDTYLFLYQLTVSSNLAEIGIRIGTGVGPTYQTASYQGSPDGATDRCNFAINQSNAADSYAFGQLWIANPELATQSIFYGVGGAEISGTLGGGVGGGGYTGAAAMTGLRFLPSAGTISGRITMYGVTKTP